MQEHDEHEKEDALTLMRMRVTLLAHLQRPYATLAALTLSFYKGDL